MIEELASLLLTDEPTLYIAMLAAMAGAWLIRDALESSRAAALYFPVLVALALAANYLVNAFGLAEPITQLSFRESDAAESIASLAFTAFAISSGVTFGSLLLVRLQKREVTHEPEEL